MLCATCQRALPDQTNYCPLCGTPVLAVAETRVTQGAAVVIPNVADVTPDAILVDPVLSTSANPHIDMAEPPTICDSAVASDAGLEFAPVLPEHVSSQKALQTTGKTFGSRAGAYIVDTLICSAIVLAGAFALSFLASLAFVLAGRALLPASTPPGISLGTIVLSLALGVLYFAVYEWLFGASPGKLILKMRVVREDGQRPGFGTALLRGVFRFLDGLFFGFPAWVAMNRDCRRQRYGDRYAHTLVVDYRDPIIHYQRSWPWFLVATLLACVLLSVGTMLIQAPAIRVAPPRTMAAASDLNVRLQDLGQGFVLADEVGKEGFADAVLDANVRLFVSDDVNVQAMVLTFPFYPTDTLEQLLAGFRQEMLSGDPTLQLSFDAIRQIPVGDPAGVVHFTQANTGEEGYLLFSIHGNVLTRLFSYGAPGVMSEDELVRLAHIVDSHIR